MDEANNKVVKPNKWKQYFGRILTVHGITEMAVLVAIAIIFDLPGLKISFAPGASISLTMVPLFIIALRFPVLDSFLGIGVVYGFITMLLDRALFASYPLDYFLGYGSIALASLFQPVIYQKHKSLVINHLYLALAVIVGVSVRIFWSTISGMLLYSATLWGSFIFNSPSMAASGVIAILMLQMLYPTLVMFNRKKEVRDE